MKQRRKGVGESVYVDVWQESPGQEDGFLKIMPCLGHPTNVRHPSHPSVAL